MPDSTNIPEEVKPANTFNRDDNKASKSVSVVSLVASKGESGRRLKSDFVCTIEQKGNPNNPSDEMQISFRLKKRADMDEEPKDDRRIAPPIRSPGTPVLVRKCSITGNPKFVVNSRDLDDLIGSSTGDKSVGMVSPSLRFTEELRKSFSKADLENQAAAFLSLLSSNTLKDRLQEMEAEMEILNQEEEEKKKEKGDDADKGPGEDSDEDEDDDMLLEVRHLHAYENELTEELGNVSFEEYESVIVNGHINAAEINIDDNDDEMVLEVEEEGIGPGKLAEIGPTYSFRKNKEQVRRGPAFLEEMNGNKGTDKQKPSSFFGRMMEQMRKFVEQLIESSKPSGPTIEATKQDKQTPAPEPTLPASKPPTILSSVMKSARIMARSLFNHFNYPQSRQSNTSKLE